ncbi:MAG: ABC transporter permease [Spirochaetaceae bacterium]|nr:ABC transporter permease [Spirochaetaceae bacterium]
MSTLYFTGNALDWAALLLCAAAGFAVCGRAGLFNLGLEGQIYTGGFTASAVMLALSRCGTPPFFVLAAGLTGAALSAGILGAVSGLLKKHCGASELISSFLLSAFVSAIIDYLIAGPLRGTAESLLAMEKLPRALLLARILPPSSLNPSVFAAAALVVLCWLFLMRTPRGYRLRLAGTAPEFARFGGIDARAFWTGSMAFSGACAGLAGFFAVAGTDGICHQGFPSGLGWAAITTGMIARSKPLLLFPAAVFYAALKHGSNVLLLTAGGGGAAFNIVSGLALFAATAHIRPGRPRH